MKTLSDVLHACGLNNNGRSRALHRFQDKFGATFTMEKMGAKNRPTYCCSDEDLAMIVLKERSFRITLSEKQKKQYSKPSQNMDRVTTRNQEENREGGFYTRITSYRMMNCFQGA